VRSVKEVMGHTLRAGAHWFS